MRVLSRVSSLPADPTLSTAGCSPPEIRQEAHVPHHCLSRLIEVLRVGEVACFCFVFLRWESCYIAKAVLEPMNSSDSLPLQRAQVAEL
jgi:hypothetical protein